MKKMGLMLMISIFLSGLIPVWSEESKGGEGETQKAERDAKKMEMLIKELNLSELKFLEKENLDLKDMEHFRDKKIKFKNLIDSLLKTTELNEEKDVVISQLKELLELEDKIGKAYKLRLQDIQNGLIHINTARKLRKTYGKGGMNFLSIDDKNLK